MHAREMHARPFLQSQSNERLPRSCSSWSTACRSSLAVPSSTRRRISLITLAAAAAVEHGLAAGPPARPPAAIEGLDRGAPRQAQRPLGPKLENGIAAPEHYRR